MKTLPKDTIKTIVITILLTANIAFVAGIKYNQNQTAHIKAEVQSQLQTFLDSQPKDQK